MRRGGGKVLLLCALMFLAFVSRAQQHRTDEDELSSRVFRGLGISGEPSLYDQCANNEYAAFRIFEYIAMSPLSIIRAESIDDASRLTKITFDNEGKPDSVTKDLSSTQWNKLVDVIRASGFWEAEAEESVWNPDGLKWLIEGCYQGAFHSLMLYPEQDYRMHEAATYVRSLAK